MEVTQPQTRVENVMLGWVIGHWQHSTIFVWPTKLAFSHACYWSSRAGSLIPGLPDGQVQCLDTLADLVLGQAWKLSLWVPIWRLGPQGPVQCLRGSGAWPHESYPSAGVHGERGCSLLSLCTPGGHLYPPVLPGLGRGSSRQCETDFPTFLNASSLISVL